MKNHKNWIEPWKTIKTDLEPWKTNTGGSDDFSLQTNRHFIIIHISSASSSSGADHYDRVDPTLPLMVFIQANFAHIQRFIYKPYIIYFIIWKAQLKRDCLLFGDICQNVENAIEHPFLLMPCKVGVKALFRIFFWWNITHQAQVIILPIWVNLKLRRIINFEQVSLT